MANDMMPHFELFQPADLDTAFALLDRWGDRGWKLAGGHDSLDWFKDRTRQPKNQPAQGCWLRAPPGRNCHRLRQWARSFYSFLSAI